MTFPILGGNGAVAGGYSIDNSIRFNDGDSPRLDRTNVASPTNSKKYTYSVWIKRSAFSDGNNRQILSAINGNNRTQILFRSGSNEAIRVLSTTDAFSTFKYLITTNALYRDASAWYHVVCVFDSTDATANDRFKIYVNGVEQSLSISTSVASNYDDPINSGSVAQDLGHADGSEIFDGYIAETHFIDGQALSPTDFGEFDADSGIWKPKQYSGSYGTNGFYLPFNTGTIGEDLSGNSNDFTATNLSATTDITTDTPTNNFATMNPLHSEGITFSEGNLDILASTTFWNVATSTIPIPSSGKWYMEAKITAIQAGGHNSLGFLDANFPFTTNDTATAFTGGGNPSWITYVYFHATNDNAYVNLADGSGYAFENNTTFSAGVNDILMMAFDRDNNKIWFGKNGDWAKANGTTGANPSTGADATVSSIPTDVTYMPNFGCGDSSARQQWNFGNPPFSISSGNSDDNGYGNFEYAPPSGFLALCTQNLATELSPTIDDGSEYFNTITYTANRTARSLTGVGFQPDWVWIKDRGGAQSHALFDSNRGVNKQLRSDTTGAELTAYSDLLTSFDSDGFSLGADASVGDVNYDLQSHVAWNWKANAGSTSSNTDGATTSTVQVNQSAGFSIVTYDMGGSPSTFGHGLGKTPSFIIFKRKDAVGSWVCYHQSIGVNGIILLNGTDGAYTGFNYFPTMNSTVVGVAGSSDMYNNTIAYCFAEIEGYSKMGSYTGNGSSDGVFVYTGFRPSWIMIKRTTNTSNWFMFDNKRNEFNLVNKSLYANQSTTETIQTTNVTDFLSNGFKIRGTGGSINGSGDTFIYMAFAENPFVSSTGIPVTAR